MFLTDVDQSANLFSLNLLMDAVGTAPRHSQTIGGLAYQQDRAKTVKGFAR